MMPNPNQLMQAVQRLKANPAEILRTKFNIPQSVNINDPNQIIQHLLNTGQTTQQQVNAFMGRGLFR